jgi:putative transposase
MKKRTGITKARLIKLIEISRSKYYEWTKRLGMPNSHNKEIPRYNWITPIEKEKILEYIEHNCYVGRHFTIEGYRRITYKMLDSGIVAVSPTTVYWLMRKMDLMNRWSTIKNSLKGTGYKQPSGVHEEWHTDIKYVNFKGTFIFFIGVLDGYSRYIVHHELRLNMTEYDVEIVVQGALDKFPGEKPRIISDNGSQYISKDFQIFLKEIGLQHIKTSIGYPQSNGKIERFHRTLEDECIRTRSMIDIEDARNVIEKYVNYYNTVRLHSALNYLTPEDYLLGRVDSRLRERERKLKSASESRKLYWSKVNVAC